MNPYSHYQRTQVTTASRGKILLMLYEGAIRFTRLAIDALEKKQIAQKGTYVSRVTAILSELMATLDFKTGGQLAVDLENLYVFMIDRFIEGNVQNNVQCFKDVERLLVTLYTAWKDVIENPRPDGIPSKQLQPDLFEKFNKSHVIENATNSNEKGVDAAGSSAKPKLKLLA